MKSKITKKIILKIGGSLITKKDAKEFPKNMIDINRYADEYIRFDVLNRIASEIKKARQEKEFALILINGVGPFGHFLVDTYLKNKKGMILETIHDSVKLLNKKIVDCFAAQGLDLVAIHPFNVCYFASYGFDISNLWAYVMRTLEDKKIPSLHGDIVPAIGVKGRLSVYEVISGDDIAVELAKAWRADKIIMATDVDGVFNKNPKINKKANLIKKIKSGSRIKYDMNAVDVTGGLKKKVEKLKNAAGHGVNSQIINGLVKGNVKKALLDDETIGTLIVGVT